MTLLLKLFLAHLLGDFVFQPEKWVRDKELKKIRSPYLYVHVLIHILALLVVLQFDWSYIWGVGIIAVSHLIIDVAKSYLSRRPGRILFLLDQLVHIVVLVLVTRIYVPLELQFGSIYSYEGLLLVTSIVMLTFVSSILIKVLVAPMHPQSGDGGKKSLDNAGRYIGVLERLFVFAFVVLNHWEAVGFLLAAKSVFRFGDLRDAHDIKLTEYILIGTLLSFGLGILVASAYQYLLIVHSG